MGALGGKSSIFEPIFGPKRQFSARFRAAVAARNMSLAIQLLDEFTELRFAGS